MPWILNNSCGPFRHVFSSLARINPKGKVALLQLRGHVRVNLVQNGKKQLNNFSCLPHTTSITRDMLEQKQLTPQQRLFPGQQRAIPTAMFEMTAVRGGEGDTEG